MSAALLPVTRRGFLQGSLALGAGLLLARGAPVAVPVAPPGEAKLKPMEPDEKPVASRPSCPYYSPRCSPLVLPCLPPCCRCRP